MLRKLMKHELRATARVMGPMLGLTLLSAVGGNVAVHNLLEADSALLSLLGSFMLTAFMATLAAVFIVSFALMIQRFYKNLLRDEGYLMMTLPVTVHEHILSKLFVSLIWAAAAAVVMALSMGILVFRIEYIENIMRELSEIIPQLKFKDLLLADYMGHAVLYFVELILLLIAADSCLCLQLYAAMAAGHSFTHHKGALSVAAFFAFSTIWSVIRNGAAMLLNWVDWEGLGLWLGALPEPARTHIVLLGATAMLLIPCALWYAVTAYFLKNRLNID